MLAISLIVVSLLLGYFIAVVLSMLSTFSIARRWPGFAVQDHRLRGSYLLFQDALWLVSGAAAGYAASWLVADTYPWVTATLLSAALIGAMWRNTEEIMQRGLAHMLLASTCIVAGVAAGFALHLR